MAKKEKKFKVPKRKQPIYSCFKPIFRLFLKKPRIINLAGDLAEKSIVVANHSAKSGPPSLDFYYPVATCKWGAYQMLGNYKSRRNYLKNVLYIQKCGKKPLPSAIMSTILAVPSPWIYKGMRMMASYPDGRLMQTIRNSVEVLDANYSVMIYPENSNDGYKDVLTEFFPGFVMLAERYYRLRGVDLPVYPVYYHIKKRIMVIGKPMYVQKMVEEGLDRYQIAERYKDAVNQLYFDYVEKTDKKGRPTEDK